MTFKIPNSLASKRRGGKAGGRVMKRRRIQNKLAREAPRVRIGIEHEYGEHTRVGESWEKARWRETIAYKSICKTCRGSGEGAGCHEQGGWTMGLCPTCCGYGYSYSNAKPRGRWKKGPSPLYAGQ